MVYVSTSGSWKLLINNFQLPYLHGNSFNNFEKRSKYLGESKSVMPDGWPEQTKAAYEAMKANSRNSPWHPRRTLDQFYYSSLPETKSRDKGQVVSKNTNDSRGGKKMVMVDQLWLWFLEGKNGDTYVFTYFPRKDEEPKDNEHEDGENGDVEGDLVEVADLRRAILDEVNSRGLLSISESEFVALVVKQAINVILKVRHEESLDIFIVFRAAIGKAVS